MGDDQPDDNGDDSDELATELDAELELMELAAEWTVLTELDLEPRLSLSPSGPEALEALWEHTSEYAGGGVAATPKTASAEESTAGPPSSRTISRLLATTVYGGGGGARARMSGLRNREAMRSSVRAADDCIAQQAPWARGR